MQAYLLHHHGYGEAAVLFRWNSRNWHRNDKLLSVLCRLTGLFFYIQQEIPEISGENPEGERGWTEDGALCKDPENPCFPEGNPSRIPDICDGDKASQKWSR